MNQEELWQKKWNEHSHELSTNSFAKKIYKYITPKHHTLLDIGCGNGIDSMYFAKKGLKVTSIDWSKPAIKHLEKRIKKGLNISTNIINTENINFKENSFDIIYAHLSLHYFNEKTTKKIFEKLYKILKRDGILFIKCKSTQDALFGKGEKIEENMYKLDGQIRHFFDQKYTGGLLKYFDNVKISQSSSTYINYKSNFIEAIAYKNKKRD